MDKFFNLNKNFKAIFQKIYGFDKEARTDLVFIWTPSAMVVLCDSTEISSIPIPYHHSLY